MKDMAKIWDTSFYLKRPVSLIPVFLKIMSRGEGKSYFYSDKSGLLPFIPGSKIGWWRR